jgi:hypothetical protein
MPLRWMISQPERFVSVEAEDLVHYGDVHTFLEAVRIARAISFRKLVDVREGSTEMSQADSMSFAGMLSALSSIEPMGAKAPQLGPEGATGHAPLVMGLMMLKSPCRVFHDDLSGAHAWITRQP